ncbi:serum response factor-binding protein 1-like [Venturia canescens]|uniref:serum response factor-binding protein 1-like n=1 Tax=Venturia canescens TaxID=32260 RepID=UPI001C9CCEBB|nr:serum response factor-binding protein 1-like [Venturia canescens]
MSKIAINNEIVLMRHAVRKSRVSLVRKLIKEVKLLRARKHGDEKVVEKCQRKAERLAAEIEALKKIKDDDISKFGITLTKNLPEILSDKTAEPHTRVMARLTFHKFLNERIQKFKDKYPAYEEHLGPGRKKLSKIQRKAHREAINRIKAGGETKQENHREDKGLEKEIKHVNHEREDDEREEDEEITHSEEEDEAVHHKILKNIREEEISNESMDNESSGLDSEAGSILRISNLKRRKNNDSESEEINSSETDISDESISSTSASAKSRKLKKSKTILSDPVKAEKKNENSKKLKRKESIAATKSSAELEIPGIIKKNPEASKNSKTETKNVDKSKKSVPIKVISEEASVKRFTDLIKEKECLEIVKPMKTVNLRKDVKLEKEIDSFFMTANGESEYMSVVVPKLKPCEDDEQDDRFAPNHVAKRQKNFHEKNNKFFSKIDQRSNDNSSNRFPPNADKRRQNNFSNSNNSSDKYPQRGNDYVRNSRNAKSNHEKNNVVKDEELHPSWQARKKQQEILKQGFQGKKIVFND